MILLEAEADPSQPEWDFREVCRGSSLRALWTRLQEMEGSSEGCFCGVHSTTSPLPPFFCCCLWVFFSTVYFGMCAHPLAVQLGSCSAVSSLQGGCRGSRSVFLQMGSVGGLSHRAVGCVSHCHPEPSQTGTSVEVWKMTGSFPGSPRFPANPTCVGSLEGSRRNFFSLLQRLR